MVPELMNLPNSKCKILRRSKPACSTRPRTLKACPSHEHHSAAPPTTTSSTSSEARTTIITNLMIFGSLTLHQVAGDKFKFRREIFDPSLEVVTPLSALEVKCTSLVASWN